MHTYRIGRHAAVAPHALLFLLGCMAVPAFSGAARAFQRGPAATHTGDNQHAYARFDIRPQPLVAALRIYSETTGLAVLVDDGLTAGRVSPGVHGELSAAEALQQLLADTGLAVRYVSAGAFTLVPIAAGAPGAGASSAAAVPIEAADPERMQRSYASLVQRTLERGLCASELTRPGNYRLALQLWIGSAGQVVRLHRLGGTGDAARDRAIDALLGSQAFAPPPAELTPPLTILLRPQANFDCATVQG